MNDEYASLRLAGWPRRSTRLVDLDTTEAVAVPRPMERSIYAPATGAKPKAFVVTLLIHVAVIAAIVIKWTSVYSVAKPAAPLVVDMLPLASPPEPPSETPSGTEPVETKKSRARQDLPEVELLEIEIPHSDSLALPSPESTPDPRPLVKDTSAPEGLPLPPAPQISTGKPTWEGLVLGALSKVKRYPREASFRRQKGVPYVRFVMDRDGKVLSVRLERSSGFRALDEEAIALPSRAQPLPKPPTDVPGDTIELVVPIEFFLRARP